MRWPSPHAENLTEALQAVEGISAIALRKVCRGSTQRRPLAIRSRAAVVAARRGRRALEPPLDLRGAEADLVLHRERRRAQRCAAASSGDLKTAFVAVADSLSFRRPRAPRLTPSALSHTGPPARGAARHRNCWHRTHERRRPTPGSPARAAAGPAIDEIAGRLDDLDGERANRRPAVGLHAHLGGGGVVALVWARFLAMLDPDVHLSHSTMRDRHRRARLPCRDGPRDHASGAVRVMAPMKSPWSARPATRRRPAAARRTCSRATTGIEFRRGATVGFEGVRARRPRAPRRGRRG